MALLCRELEELRRGGRLRRLDVQAASADGFQGCERDVIIVSCVRGGGASGGSIGFLKEVRRLNVAVTRGRWAAVLLAPAGSAGRSAELHACTAGCVMSDE